MYRTSYWTEKKTIFGEIQVWVLTDFKIYNGIRKCPASDVFQDICWNITMSSWYKQNLVLSYDWF